MICDDTICFRNRKSALNFGAASGREFAIFFSGESSYFVFKDGSSELVKKSAAEDRALFEFNCTHPNGELYAIKFKDIKWNILDFS